MAASSKSVSIAPQIPCSPSERHITPSGSSIRSGWILVRRRQLAEEFCLKRFS